jgi:uncharacterized protein DUF2516
MLMQGFGTLLWILHLVVLALAVFAFVDAAFRRDDAYRAAGKQNKPFWLVILGLAILVNVFLGGLLGILTIAGLIASIVYIVDVRPAIRQLTGGGTGGMRRGLGGGRWRRRPGGSSSDGPYGPFNGR